MNRNPLGWSAISFVADDVIEITDTAGVKGVVRMGHQFWATSAVDFYPLNARYAVKNQFSTIRPPLLSWKVAYLGVKGFLCLFL